MVWMKKGILYHTYFEKSMKNQVTIMQRSAMSEHQRMAILSNELVRRLSNIHREVVEEEIEPVIEHYITQLKNSGYTRKQAKETVVCGVVGWRRKLERREKNGQRQYLETTETLEQRTEDQLLELVQGRQKEEKRECRKQIQVPTTPIKEEKGRTRTGKEDQAGEGQAWDSVQGKGSHVCSPSPGTLSWQKG